MAKHAFHFRALATDETEYWNLPEPLKGATVFGVYFLLEGEATHICSLTPSSRAEFLQNEFLRPADEEAADAFLQGAGSELIYENGGEWTSYFGFIDPTAKNRRPYVSQRHTFSLDSRDHDLDTRLYEEELARALRFESARKARATARYNCLREHAYEEAREYFQGNWPSAPVLMGGAAFEQHRQRRARG